jgi:hypothetical protein
MPHISGDTTLAGSLETGRTTDGCVGRCDLILDCLPFLSLVVRREACRWSTRHVTGIISSDATRQIRPRAKC